MATLTLDEFKELRAQGLSTDQIIRFDNGEKPVSSTKQSLREGTPLESKLYTEIVSPILSGGSTFALGLPKMMADQQGEGMREAVFPEQTTLPGKVLRGASEAAGFTVGLPMRVGAAVGRLGVSAGRRLFPQIAAQTGKLATTSGQAGRLATEGAAAGLALEPEHNMSRLEQAMLFGGFGGAAPVAVQGVKGIGGFVGNNFKAIVKNIGGISDSTLKTIRELGANKVFEPAKASADYISTNLLPRTRAKIDSAIATFTPNIQRLLKDKYGVADEAISVIKKRGVAAVNVIRQKYNDSTDYFHKVIKSGIDAKKAAADKAYADAVDAMKGDSIYIDSTLRTLKNKLTMAKYVDFMGNPMQSYKSGLDPQLDALTSLYLQLKPGATAAGTTYKGALISKDQFSLYRDLLGRMLRERPSDRYVMAVRNALYKDAERSGMTGLRAARDMERKAFSVIGKYMGKDGSIKALGKEPSLDRYHSLAEEQKRQLRDLEKFVGVKFVDELEALTAARNLDKLSKFTDEQIVSDLISARNPNQTKMVLSKYRSILGNSFKDESDDLMAHFANSDFNIISSTPGAGGGIFPSRSGLLRSMTSEAAKRYLRDIRPSLGRLSGVVSGTGQRLKQAVIQEREKPDYRIKGLTVEDAPINPKFAPKAGAERNVPKTRPEDFATAEEYVASKGIAGVDKDLLSDMRSNIAYLKNNSLIARVNIDDRIGRTDAEMLSMGLFSREAKDKIKDIVDIIGVEPKLKFLIDDDIKKLLKIQRYRDEVFTPNAELKSQLTAEWEAAQKRNKTLGVLGATALGSGIASQAKAEQISDKDKLYTILGEAEASGLEGMRAVASAMNNGNPRAYGKDVISEENGKFYATRNGKKRLIPNYAVVNAKKAIKESNEKDFSNGANHWFSDADLKTEKVQKMIKNGKMKFIMKVGGNSFYKE